MAKFHVSVIMIWTITLVNVIDGVNSSTTTFTPKTFEPLGCVHNSKMYAPGESFNPSPCEHCFCTPGGQPACAIADCFVAPCVDAVKDAKKCCPVCPNGPNCAAPDKTIIKQGDVYHPDPQTSCVCPNRIGFGPSLSLCHVEPTFTLPPITAQVVS